MSPTATPKGGDTYADGSSPLLEVINSEQIKCTQIFGTRVITSMIKRVGMRALLATALFAGVFVSCSGGGTPASVQPSPGSIPGTVDAIVRAEMQRTGIPAVAVGLAKNGTVVYVQGYGLADVQTDSPATPNTIFELASLTKQFTAVLVMQLKEEQLLQVDDPVAKYLSDYGFPPSITLRMLLNQTSGLTDYLDLPAFQQWYLTGVDEATVLSAVSGAPLEFSPGTAWRYSNSNYFVLGAVIEKITAQSYASNLNTRIFGPLRLSSAYYNLPPEPPAALGYTSRSGVVTPVNLANRSSLFAAGAISADVDDVLNWDQDLYANTIVSSASFKDMTTPAPIGVGDGSFYGYGLFLDTFAGRHRGFHTGFINGFLSYNELFLDNGFSLVVLMNADFDDQQALGDKIYTAVCEAAEFTGTC